MYKSRKSVIVAIIYNENRDKVLTSRRDESKHQGGLWEFPGGKAEHNETDWQALSRELHEELGIHAVSGKYS
ncbi:MAG: NUDIX domain-containing protein, partial [Gammaproteobacteria bacterium]|nr:NUDIX domain-containing protein [Gammaproteobacteria bacterium]